VCGCPGSWSGIRSKGMVENRQGYTFFDHTADVGVRAEGKTLSAVVQDALRQARVERRLQELRGVQGFWSRKARDKGILTEQDLERYLGA